MIINGELLSEVMHLNILKYRIGHTYVHYDYFKDGVTYTGFKINIYELAHKNLKQWAWSYKSL